MALKLGDLIPAKEQFEALEGIERRLEQRRYQSQWRALLAIASAVVQIAVLFWPKGYDLDARLQQLVRRGVWQILLHPAAWRLSEVIPLLPFAAMLIFGVWWVILRYTGVLFRQSRETFRYTFSVGDFAPVDGIPRDGADDKRPDPLQLLAADLSERLNKRVGRLSLLKSPEGGETAAGGAGSRAAATDADGGWARRSHFHVEGVYGLRQDADGDWAMQVWPRVRIGSGSNPFTLSFPVRLPLDQEDGASQEPSPASRCRLGPAAYERLVERLYSSVATEIYRQIELDLGEKMKLFPTASLRAAARYYEAKDFENSTTIDSYDQALAMYRHSMDSFEASWLHGIRRMLAFWAPPLMWWDAPGIRPALRLEAKTELGYARCLIYRQLASRLAGRSSEAIFPVRAALQKSRRLLRWCYRASMPLFGAMPRSLSAPLLPVLGWRRGRGSHGAGRKSKGGKAYLRFGARSYRLAWLAFPRVSPWHPLRRRICESLREELCEAYAVSALAHSLLLDSRRAAAYLRRAEALGDGVDARRALRLLVKAELEPSLPLRLVYLNEAKDLDPESEVILYRLASVSDFLARDRNLIGKERVGILVRQHYEAVLKVNPGNIASLIGQGYLLWLVGDLDKAAAKFKAGIEVQQVVRRTFVGDLRYGLARVRAEQAAKLLERVPGPAELAKARLLLNQAAADYDEATLADPRVAAGSGATQGSSGAAGNSYYEFITEAIRKRYGEFCERIERLDDQPWGGNPDGPDGGEGRKNTLGTVVGYALNDYGNACLSYYLRSEVGTPSNRYLRLAVESFRKARRALSGSTRVQYNLFVAETWLDGERAWKEADELAAQILDRRQRLLGNEMMAVMSFLSLPPERRPAEDEARPSKARLGSAADGAPPRAASPAQPKQNAEIAPAQSDGPPPPAVANEPAAQATAGGAAYGQPQADAKGGYLTAAAARTDDATRRRSEAETGAPPAPEAAIAMVQRALQAEAQSPPEPRSRDFTETVEKPQRIAAESRGGGATAKFLMQGPLRAIEGTRLSPFRVELEPTAVADLLDNRKVDWSRLGDHEVVALVTLVQWWTQCLRDPALRERHQWAPQTLVTACRRVSALILDDYYPEHYETLTALLQLHEIDDAGASEASHAAYYEAMRRAHDWAVRFDPASQLYRKLRLNLCDRRAWFLTKGDAANDPARLREALEVYGQAHGACDELAEYHASLSQLHESLEQRLAAAPAPDRAEVRSQRRQAFLRMEQALRRDPRNQDYADRRAMLRSRLWVEAEGLENGDISRAGAPDAVQVELSESLVDDLGLTKDGLPAGLQASISAARERLGADPALVLPGVRFRDNTAFADGHYRVVIRGVPLAMYVLDKPLPREQKWQALTAVLEIAARAAAAEIFDVQDASNALRKLADSGHEQAALLRKNAGALAVFTRVLQRLLAGAVPVVDLSEITAEFQRCRLRTMSLTSTVEAIRALPPVAARLPGNGEGIRTVTVLDDALERRVTAAIKRSGPEPVLHAASLIRTEIRRHVRASIGDAARPATVITGPGARPFVAGFLERPGEGLFVLSHREAHPRLLAKVR